MEKLRDEMSLEEEKTYINELFDKLEAEGYVETYTSPYTDEDARANVGQKFTVVRRLTTEDNVDLECLPIWLIRLENGKEINAYPEEIIQSVIDKNPHAFYFKDKSQYPKEVR